MTLRVVGYISTRPLIVIARAYNYNITLPSKKAYSQAILLFRYFTSQVSLDIYSS
jgi:hypothetical protein